MPDTPFALREASLQIAWDFLERTGQIDDPWFTANFLGDTIEQMIRQGQTRRLLLSNRAISAYQRYKAADTSRRPPASTEDGAHFSGTR